jgi:glycosyltransferase involved in cell wall biosynthesis
LRPSHDRPLTIGFDARELQGRPTGTGRYLRNLLRVWSEGPDRLVAYLDGAAPDDPALRATRVETRVLGDRPRRGVIWQERLLPRAARADGIDVFFSPAYTCPLTLRVPRVTAVHDLSFFSLPHDFSALDGLRRRLLVAASLRASRAVVTISDFTRREIGARFPEVLPRVTAIPLGADDDLAPAPGRERARRRLDVRGPLLLSVGSVFDRRCLPVLLRAVAGLVPSWPELRLDVVGENRSSLDLAALVRSAGLRRHVRLSGFVDENELALRYAAADVAVFLSEYEGFGLPALEAMARGVASVVSSAPAMGELFADGAVLVEPHDDAAVRGAIDGLLRDPAARAERVARGRALARRFSWRATALRTREVLAAAAS